MITLLLLNYLNSNIFFESYSTRVRQLHFMKYVRNLIYPVITFFDGKWREDVLEMSAGPLYGSGFYLNRSFLRILYYGYVCHLVIPAKLG